jgi:hypothetical protein
MQVRKSRSRNTPNCRLEREVLYNIMYNCSGYQKSYLIIMT